MLNLTYWLTSPGAIKHRGCFNDVGYVAITEIWQHDYESYVSESPFNHPYIIV